MKGQRMVRGALAALATVGLGGMLASPAASDETSAVGLLATASAQGARVTWTIPGFLVVETVFDAGGPVAQSLVDGAGGRSFASQPYPGETALIAPGLPNVLGLPSVPVNYPFYAAAQYPGTPEAQVADPSGSYRLDARAGDHSAMSEALTKLGPAEAGAMTSRATSGIDRGADGSVTAQADSLTEGVSLGTLHIGSVRSQSTTVAAPGQPSQTTQSLVVEGARFGDTPLSIGPDGAQGPAGSLNEALAQSGLSVRVLSGSAVSGGRTGDVLEVRSVHPVPGANQGVAVWRFGGVTTSVVAGSPGGDVVLPDTPPTAETAAPPPESRTPEVASPASSPSPSHDISPRAVPPAATTSPAVGTLVSQAAQPDAAAATSGPDEEGSGLLPTGALAMTTGAAPAAQRRFAASVSGSLQPAAAALMVGTAIALVVVASAARHRRES